MENNEITLQKPAFWRILVAYLIDFAFLQMVLFVFYWGVVIVGMLAINYDYHSATLGKVLLGAMLLYLFFFPVIYYAILETWRGASLGKMAVELHVKHSSAIRILVSYVLDFVCIVLCSWILHGMFFNFLGPVGAVFFPLCLGIDFILLEGLSGASLGKWICGVRVYQKLK